MTRTLTLAVLLCAILTGCGEAPPPTASQPVEQKAKTPPKNPKTGLTPANPQ